MALAPASATTGTDLTGPLVRLANSAIAPGMSGILGSTDLFPRGLGQDGVGLDPGAAAINNTYSGAVLRESYLVGNDGPGGDAIVDIPASGSSGKRTDYVILRIEDDNFAGEASNPKSCRFARVSSLGSKQYPYIPICKVEQPKSNTAGIQQSMVTDLRRAVPIQFTQDQPRPSVSEDVGQKLHAVGSTGEFFPNNGIYNFDCPEWASHMIVEMQWINVRMPNENTYGSCWAEFGDKTGTHNREFSVQKFQFDGFNAADKFSTNWFAFSGSRKVPDKLIGETIRFGMKAAYSSSSGQPSWPVRLNAKSGVRMKVTFQLVASAPDDV